MSVIPAIAEKVEPLLRSVLDTGEPVLGQELRGATAATTEERYWLDELEDVWVLIAQQAHLVAS